MLQQEKISLEQMREATALISRHLGMEVAEAAIHGSVLRGFNDPNSDVDICFLINRPISDYLHITSTSRFFECTMDDRRKRTMELSRLMSSELGWNVMITLVDMRSLMRGIMGSSIFSLIAYENFAKQNQFVKELFEPVAVKYFKVPNLVFRCGQQITDSLRSYEEITKKPVGQQYKQERTFLGTFWSAHRLLAYIGGDTGHSRTIHELIEFNREACAEEYPEGFHPKAVGVIKARTHRSPFELPVGVDDVSSDLLRAFVAKVLAAATVYLRGNPHRQPSAMDETVELVDLYGLLLDQEEEKRQRQRLAQELQPIMFPEATA